MFSTLALFRYVRIYLLQSSFVFACLLFYPCRGPLTNDRFSLVLASLLRAFICATDSENEGVMILE